MACGGLRPKGAARTRMKIWARQVAGAIEMCRCRRVMTMLIANESGITIVSRFTRPPPAPGPPTITPTPASATSIAAHERAEIGSRSITHARRAANIGAAACRKRTCATLV